MPEIDPIEHQSQTKLFFVLGGLFLFVSVWAFYDEMVSRRSWKQYRREFNALELKRIDTESQQLKQALQAEDARREALPEQELVEDQFSLRRIRLKREQAEIRMEGEEYRGVSRRLKELEIRLSDAQQRQGFAKADQDEIYYEWKHAQEKGETDAADRHRKEFQELEERLVRLKGEGKVLERAVAEAKGEAAAFESEVKKWKDAEKKHREPISQLEKKREAVLSRGLEIQQVVVDDLGKGGAVIWGAVDRCSSCHAAIDRDGFENEKNPFQTHPHRKEIFGSHPVEKFGCTTCHGGQGRATQIKGKPLEEGDYVHGLVHHWEEQLLRGADLQSSCVKCHQDQWKLDYAPVMMAGKKAFWDLGCTGCHAVKGFEDAPKVGPSLRRLSGKVSPEWLAAWIKDPPSYLPHTRMPTPPLDLDES